MKKDIIKALTYPANVTAWIFGQNQGNWQGFNPDKNLLAHKVISDTEIKFYWKNDPNGTYLVYKNIRPNKVTKTTYGDAKIISSDIRDAYSSVASNLSDTVTMDRTYSITEGSETSTVDNIGISVAIGLEQSISYGSALGGAAGETKLSVSIDTSFSHEWASGQSEERTIETSISIPPRTKTTLTATKSRSKLRQTISYECDLDYTVVFESWGICKFEVESTDIMEKAFNGEYFDGRFVGIDGGAQAHADQVGYSLKSQPRQYDAFLFPTVITKFDKEIKFDRSVTGEIILKSETI